MKKLLLLSLLFCVTKTKAQFVTIPDANFAAFLQSIVPTAMNGSQLDTSSHNVTSYTTSINITGKNISDIYGIQYFTSLINLDCSNNPLGYLPTLSNSLKVLYCQVNHLTSLPVLPDSLITLVCDVNQITNLPILPNTLQTLYCTNNLLTSLPVLPNSLRTLWCSDNNISCFLPFSNNINNLSIDNNPFTCLPNYITAMDSSDLTKPLCQAGNTNGCAVAAISTYNTQNSTIKIYPNPANNKITIDATDVIDVKLFDVLGKEVTNAKTNDVDISNLTNGVYFIQVQTKQNTTTQKIIVQH
jgi:hypothetical protein